MWLAVRRRESVPRFSSPSFSRGRASNRFFAFSPQEDIALFRGKFLVVLTFLACSSFASAQLPKYNAFAGYSFQLNDLNSNDHYFQLQGGEGTFEARFFPFLHSPYLSLVGDASAHFGAADQIIPQNGIQHVHVREYVFLGGPRVSFTTKNYRPFAHALVGAARDSLTASGYSDTELNFAAAFGGGLDRRIFRAFWWRFQGDLLLTRFFSSTQHNGRFSTGVVFTF